MAELVQNIYRSTQGKETMKRCLNRLFILSICAVGPGLAGCSDDSKGGQDKGAPDMAADAGAPDRATPDAPTSPDTRTPDLRPWLDPAVGIPCTTDKDCSGITPYCNLSVQVCVGCRENKARRFGSC